jgi:hypothetical protein
MAEPMLEIEMDSCCGGRRSHGVDSEVMVTCDDSVAVAVAVAVAPSLEA